MTEELQSKLEEFKNLILFPKLEWKLVGRKIEYKVVTTKLEAFIGENKEFLNSLDASTFAPLHLAVKFSSLEVVKVLFDAKPEWINNLNGFKDTVAHLLLNRIGTNATGLEILEFVLEKAPHLANQVNTFGHTPLQEVASDYGYESVELLLQQNHPELDVIGEDA